jgi:hypothetical protein
VLLVDLESMDVLNYLQLISVFSVRTTRETFHKQTFISTEDDLLFPTKQKDTYLKESAFSGVCLLILTRRNRFNKSSPIESC